MFSTIDSNIHPTQLPSGQNPQSTIDYSPVLGLCCRKIRQVVVFSHISQEDANQLADVLSGVYGFSIGGILSAPECTPDEAVDNTAILSINTLAVRSLGCLSDNADDFVKFANGAAIRYPSLRLFSLKLGCDFSVKQGESISRSMFVVDSFNQDDWSRILPDASRFL